MPKILVADDSRLHLHLISGRLQNRGFDSAKYCTILSCLTLDADPLPRKSRDISE